MSYKTNVPIRFTHNVCIHCHTILDNPITAPGVELGQAMIDSANIHFQCETQEKLEAQLLLEYERVR